MWGNGSWQPWAQEDLNYQPIRPLLHRSLPNSHHSQPFPSISSYVPRAPYQAPYSRFETRRLAPYARPIFFTGASTASTFRNPADRPDYWTPRSIVPNQPMTTPHVELWKDFGAPAKPVTVELYARKSAKQCSVRWDKPAISPQLAHTHVIKIFENETLIDTANLDRNASEYSFKTIPGEWYMCEYSIKDSRGTNTAHGSIRFRASFSMKELQLLLQKALDHCASVGRDMHPFRILYRCKPQCYWDDIQLRSQNIMRKYIKDDNGQAANPINGMIYGLFFSARLLANGTLPPSSPFGNVRMTIPAEHLLNPDRINMYFSDFYCNRLTHYVTVAICVKGSRTDLYCAEKLVPLVPDNNPFLRVTYSKRGLEFAVHKKVWVEIYFTENVPLVWGRFDRIVATGLGTSRLGGLPHNKNCTVCNLYPIGGKREVTSNENTYEEDTNEIFAQRHLEKMIESMSKTGLPAKDCEDIVFLVSGLVDQVAYEADCTVKNATTIFGNEPQSLENVIQTLNEEDKAGRPKTKGIIAKIRGFQHTVTKGLDNVQSLIKKRKQQFTKKFKK